MQFLLKRVECELHPGVFYDPTHGQTCPECDQDKIDEVERRLDGEKEEMTWE
jgi:hypothetical protein